MLHSVLFIIVVVVVIIIIFLFFSTGDGAQSLVYAKQVDRYSTTRLHFQSKAIIFFVFLYDVFWEGALEAQTGLELEVFLSLSLLSAGIELLSTAHHCAWF